MLIYEGIKSDFMSGMEEDVLPSRIETLIYEKMRRRISKNEYNAWENSLQYMYKVLNDPHIPYNSGVAIEYNIPQTAKRIDFILSGYGEKRSKNAVVIELKQWDKVRLVEGSDALVETYVGQGLRRVVHPSYQAWSYCAMLEDYNANVQDQKIKLIPCAYLHNYIKEPHDVIEHPKYRAYLTKAPVFAHGDIVKLRAFIKKFIKYGDNRETLYLIDKGKIRPSKSLQDSLTSMLKGNREFIMLDEQKVVFDEAMELAEKSKKDEKKRVYIVKGGPGTGKSVVAVNLLAELTNRDQLCQYVSKNSAPRNVYVAKLTGTLTKGRIHNLFKSSGSYVDVPKNYIDTLIVDEAHRLNEKSGMMSNVGENQIKEIINAAKCSIFFIDEHQRIHIKDIGSVEEIKKQAMLFGAEIYENELVSQFRCNGSDGYLAWIDNVLGIRETANYTLEGIDYDFHVLDDPKVLRDTIIELNRPSNRARILAGYCWEWPKKEQNNPNYHDIKIGDFGISWNLSSTSTYAIDKDSVYQAGCIHTAQGLEFDYVGVIIGNDLRYENGRVITDYTARAKSDRSIHGIKAMAKEDPEKAEKLADEIIRNTYRTLLTRGMKGCYVYCTDPGLREYLKRMMK
ncbi:MAG: DNA/RNA helicase domain-containing protein [Clostridia bacterium]|jgi:DUF2075 family protein|nr:DUF2075 domain-containing protein [Clostridiaceae bacterium]